MRSWHILLPVAVVVDILANTCQRKSTKNKKCNHLNLISLEATALLQNSLILTDSPDSVQALIILVRTWTSSQRFESLRKDGPYKTAWSFLPLLITLKIDWRISMKQFHC